MFADERHGNEGFKGVATWFEISSSTGTTYESQAGIPKRLDPTMLARTWSSRVKLARDYHELAQTGMRLIQSE